jgi:hypothetical protein
VCDPIHKLLLVNTDGAPAMTSENIGLIELCEKDPDFPYSFSYHCVVHQQAVCTKMTDFKRVMSVVQQILNSIRARPLQHRLFKQPLDETLNMSSSSFLGCTAQPRPWPLPQNPAEFLGGFSTIFFFTG